MRKHGLVLPVAAILFAVLAVSAPARAASQYPYRLVDPGTFGGPQSFLNLPAVPLTDQGTLLGTADTATRDADYPKCNPFMVGFPDRYLTHAFAWRNGRLRDLGALPGNNSSAVFEVNRSGVGAGMSETAITDPNTGWPADHAVIFKGDKVIDLGTLPGGYESQANDINNRGQVSGFASNGTRDKYSFFSVFGGPGPCGPSGWGTQARSFVWHNGVMRDIGTLGGSDAVSTTENAAGQITGQSWTNSTPNPVTHLPTLDPFLWTHGHMRNLGTLGGTIGMANWLNNRGEVVGQSNLAGDKTARPFLWKNGHMQNLGSLGGGFGFASWVNDRGDVAGSSLAPDQAFHGFLWKNGRMIDLPPVGGAPWAFANAVNDHDQVVGNETTAGGGRELLAVLWAHGHGYNLNTLVAPSHLRMISADYISNQGDIVGHGVLPNGHQRVFLLIRNRSVPLPPTSSRLARGLPAARLARPTHRCGLMDSKLPPVFCQVPHSLVSGRERPAV